MIGPTKAMFWSYLDNLFDEGPAIKTIVYPRAMIGPAADLESKMNPKNIEAIMIRNGCNLGMRKYFRFGPSMVSGCNATWWQNEGKDKE